MISGPKLARATLAALAVAGLLLAACSGDEGSEPNASEGSVNDEFTALPRFPNSEAVGTLTRSGQTTTQSFAVELSDPRKVLDWYADELAGWSETEPPTGVGEGPQLATRASWQREGSSLTISAERAPGIGNAEQTVQYNLQLRSS